jgi:hypothetical protein
MRCVVVAFLFIIFSAGPVMSWGPTGHRVVGAVAEQYLTRKARARLAKILDGQSLALASTWMDEVRSDSAYDHMADWHWVTIPDGMSYADTEKNPAGDIIATLNRVINELRQGSLNAAEERERVLILIHLVGDLHMPLHVGNGKDRGGNNTRVSWFNRPSNLHRVWDDEMINETRLSYTEFAASFKRPSEKQLRLWQQSDILVWAEESKAYRDEIYNVGDGRLSYRYSYQHMPMVRQRLLQAGIRLAGILNSIYG